MGRLLVSNSLIVRKRDGPASKWELSSRCICSPTPLMSITASLMARKSLMTSAAMSCPQSVGWGSNTDLRKQSSNTHRQHPKTNELQGKNCVENISLCISKYIYQIRRFWQPCQVVTDAMASILGRLHRSTCFAHHNFHGNSATSKSCPLQSLLNLQGQVSQKCFCLLYLNGST